jgi:L-fuconolactonase
LITEADYRAWAQQEIITCFDPVLNSFGLQRILYSSDWPVCLVAGNYGKVLQQDEEFPKKLSYEEE